MKFKYEDKKKLIIADINNLLKYMNDFERYDNGDIETYTFYKTQKIPSLLQKLNNLERN